MSDFSLSLVSLSKHDSCFSPRCFFPPVFTQNPPLWLRLGNNIHALHMSTTYKPILAETSQDKRQSLKKMGGVLRNTGWKVNLLVLAFFSDMEEFFRIRVTQEKLWESQSEGANVNYMTRDTYAVSWQLTKWYIRLSKYICFYLFLMIHEKAQNNKIKKQNKSLVWAD